MKPTNLIELARNRETAEELLSGIKSDNRQTSLQAGQQLVQDAKVLKLSLPDYLTLAIDTEKGEYKGSDLSGFEAALHYLNLPVKSDFDKGIVLELAAESFQTMPGARALFPPVIDAMLQWKYRQTSLETIANFISQSRTVNGNELVTTVIDDGGDDYVAMGVVAEGARIPIRSIKASDKAVKFYKFGGGYEFTYEFERRVSLDVITPYAARMQREAEEAEVAMALALMINGDGVNAAAPVTSAAALAAAMPDAPTTTAGMINWEVFLAWLMAQTVKGSPIDTVAGNQAAYLSWLRMFATPSLGTGATMGDALRSAGVQIALDNPGFDFNVKFAYASTAPANTLIGFNKNETVEELVENGSDIEESQRVMDNQKVRYFKTENKGYRLIFGDTRSLLTLD